MKKILVGSLVGGLIIFIWQFLSFAALNLHYPAFQYTDKQDAILTALDGLPEGGYFVPSLPKTSTEQQWKEYQKEAQGKPWATVQYHHAMDMNMGMNMTRGLVTDILAVALLCWIILRMRGLTFGRVLTACLFTGLIVFMNGYYPDDIWFEQFDTSMHLLDMIVSWGLTGLWLGWWLPRGMTRD